MPPHPDAPMPRGSWTRRAAAALVPATASPAAAHPDITREWRVLFHFEDGKVTGIGETRTFDEAFSVQLVAD